jgi:1-acyl-sn-glycerol-3-phosphate acyltransferase
MMAEVIVVLARLLSGANVRWIGCIPDASQRIYFANHTSNLDTLVLWAALPPEARAQTRPVAARDYWTTGRLRPYLAKRIFNAVLIERKKVTAHDNPVEQMLAALEEKCSLIIFPEGGRQVGPEMAPFKSGLYHLAKKRPDIEFIPVLIDNLNRILPKGEVLPVPVLSCISFGAPIRLDEHETKAAFLERARESVNRLRPT